MIFNLGILQKLDFTLILCNKIIKVLEAVKCTEYLCQAQHIPWRNFFISSQEFF